TPGSAHSSREPGRSWPTPSRRSCPPAPPRTTRPMSTESPPRESAVARAARLLAHSDLSRRRGRVADLIGLIIEATGLQVEIGEICLVGDGRDREAVACEVVGFRAGRTLLMPLGELHGIGPGTAVHP